MPKFAGRPDKPFVIELLDKKRHDRSGFRCGIAALDLYLARQAAQDMEKHAAIVYVALLEPPAIAGFYTLSQFSIDLVRLPEALAKRLSRYPVVPATLLGRLAVSERLQGQRLGETLLMDALNRALLQSRHIASAGVIVDAKDESAASFYRHYGFSSVLDLPDRMFLPMVTIETMLE
jgi:GNAT superfamily N-acetyltransferase